MGLADITRRLLADAEAHGGPPVILPTDPAPTSAAWDLASLGKLLGPSTATVRRAADGRFIEWVL